MQKKRIIVKIHFWGVRGSIPTPLTPQQIQSKILATVQRITVEDLKSSETRAKFVSMLPSWIFGTTGGNTACVELIHNNTDIILDAGTGLRVLGKSKKCPQKYHLFLSHFHWDHINGFPFFDHAFNPNLEIQIYSHYKDAKTYFYNQIREPYSPPSVAPSITKNIVFNNLQEDKEFFIDDIKVNSHKMRHPGDSYSFSFEVNGKKFVYATDIELKTTDFSSKTDGQEVFKDADVIVIDSQYTVEEVYRKENWGHSAFCYVIDFAIFWNIKKIFLFHHEPTYDDRKLDSILQAARWYAQYIGHSDIQIEIAKESLEVEL